MEFIAPTLRKIKKVCKDNDDIKSISCSIELRYHDPSIIRMESLSSKSKSKSKVDHLKLSTEPLKQTTSTKPTKDQSTSPKPMKNVGTMPMPSKQTREQSTSPNHMKTQGTSPIPSKPTKEQGVSAYISMKDKATSSPKPARKQRSDSVIRRFFGFSKKDSLNVSINNSSFIEDQGQNESDANMLPRTSSNQDQESRVSNGNMFSESSTNQNQVLQSSDQNMFPESSMIKSRCNDQDQMQKDGNTLSSSSNLDKLLHDLSICLHAKRKAYLDQRYYCKELSEILYTIAEDAKYESEENKRMTDEDNSKMMRAALKECQARHYAYIEQKEYYEMILLNKLNIN